MKTKEDRRVNGAQSARVSGVGRFQNTWPKKKKAKAQRNRGRGPGGGKEKGTGEVMDSKSKKVRPRQAVSGSLAEHKWANFISVPPAFPHQSREEFKGFKSLRGV